MRYVYIPMRGNAEFPDSPDAVATFAEAVRSANGKVLLHCTIAWRASHLWAAYLIKERGVPVETALPNARAINLMDTMRTGNSGRQPVEDFPKPVAARGRSPAQIKAIEIPFSLPR